MNNTSGQTIINKINITYDWFIKVIKPEYVDVVEGFYNILMLEIDDPFSSEVYDSSSTTKTGDNDE